MDNDGLLMRMLYVGISAVAGAITALSFMRWRDMPWPDRLLTLFVGAAFALIFVPWIVGDVFHVDMAPLRAACAITYIGAVGSNSFLPLIIRSAKRFASARLGTDEGAK